MTGFNEDKINGGMYLGSEWKFDFQTKYNIQWNIEIHVHFLFVRVKCLYKLCVECKHARLREIESILVYFLYMSGIWVPIDIDRALFLRSFFFLLSRPVC